MAILMKEILIFNNGLRLEWGMSGSDRRVLEWGKIFVHEGYRLKVFTPQVGLKRFSDFTQTQLVKTSNTDVSSGPAILVYLWRAIKTPFLIEEKNQKLIIYSSSDLLPDVLPALVAKLINPGSFFICGMHLLALNPFKRYGINDLHSKLASIYYFISQRLFMVLLRRFASLVLVSNEIDRQLLVQKGFSSNRVLVTYGAVDNLTVDKAKKQKEEFEACFIGREHPQKGFSDLVNIWEIVCRKFPKAKLALVGDLKSLFSELVKKGLVQNISCLGFLDGIAKFSVLKKSKLLLFPSYHESFGMVAAEAMACKVPVIAYNLPVYKNIYDKGMIKVSIGDYEKFAAAVISLLENEPKRRKMAREAKENSLKFSWERTGKMIIERMRPYT